MPRLFPPQPDLDAMTRAGRRVWEDLRDQLPDDAALFHQVPLQLGSREHEVDLLVAWPGVGLAVVQVEEGRVVREADGWWQGPPDAAHRIEPVRRSEDARHLLRRYLGQHGSPASRARCAHLLALPDVRVPATWEAPDCARDVIVDGDDLVGLGLRVRRTIEASGPGQPPLTHQGLESLVRLLADAMPSQRDNLLAAAAHDQRVEQMTRDQASVLDFMRTQRRVRVMGAAGTGKTWLALAQALHLARAGERVALVCRNDGAARYLERVTQEWPGRERPAYVGTLDELPVRWGAAPGADDDPDDRDRRLPQRLLELAAGRNRSALFDAVVVDEGQDVGERWWPAIAACVRDGGPRGDGPEGGLFVLMDDAPGRPAHVPIDLRPVGLGENLRSTQHVTRLVGCVSHESLRPRGAVGRPVRLVETDARDAVRTADDVVEALVAEGWRPGDVAVLTTGPRHPAQRHADDVGGRQHLWDAVLDEDEVHRGPVLGFEGLEREVVVLAVDGFEDVERAREILYRGFSRARALVVVVGQQALVEAVGGSALRLWLTRAEAWSPRRVGV